LSQTLEGTPDGAARDRDRPAGELCGRESRRVAERRPPSPLAPEQSGRELTPTGPPARARSATVQEPPPRGAVLFRFQHSLQPISTRPPCAFRLELSDRDAPAVAGMGRRLRDDGVRGRGVKSRFQKVRVGAVAYTGSCEQLDNAAADAHGFQIQERLIAVIALI